MNLLADVVLDRLSAGPLDSARPWEDATGTCFLDTLSLSMHPNPLKFSIDELFRSVNPPPISAVYSQPLAK